MPSSAICERLLLRLAFVSGWAVHSGATFSDIETAIGWVGEALASEPQFASMQNLQVHKLTPAARVEWLLV